MKAFLVLAVLYVAAFLIAIQGAQTSADGSAHKAGVSRIDPAKEADIRALMEMAGVRAMVQEATAKNADEIRQNLAASMPASDRGQEFVDAFVADYQRRFNSEEVSGQLVSIYDKHFTDDEIKGLLQFYGSPLGRKFAAEQPKITAEIQDANQVVSTQVAKDVLEDLPKEYLGINPKAVSVQARPAVQAQPVKRATQAPERHATRKHGERVSTLTEVVTLIPENSRRVGPVTRPRPPFCFCTRAREASNTEQH